MKELKPIAYLQVSNGLRSNEAMRYTRMLHFHFTLRWSQYDSMCAVCSIKEHRDKEEGRGFEVQ
jgi:hypothetical protein